MYRSLVLLLFGVAVCLGTQCDRPTAQWSHWVTTDAFFMQSSTLIVQFKLDCANGATDLALYAELMGEVTPVALLPTAGVYSVTRAGAHTQIAKGQYTVRVFDEDGYAQLRKAQRNSGDVSAVAPLVSTVVHHGGASTGPWLSMETAALLVSAALLYAALSWKAQLQS